MYRKTVTRLWPQLRLRSVRKDFSRGLGAAVAFDAQQSSIAVTDALAHAQVDQEDETVEILEHRALQAFGPIVEVVRARLMSEDDVLHAESIGISEKSGNTLIR